MADDNNFVGQLEGWYNQIVKRAKLTTAQKTEINTAGAKVFQEVLREETPYNPDRKGVHMRDAITFVPGKNADNLPNGATDVGWDKDHAYIARIMNDGKKKMSPKEQAQLHFKDHAVEKARPLVLAAKAEAYRRIVNGGGNNDSSAKGTENS